MNASHTFQRLFFLLTLTGLLSLLTAPAARAQALRGTFAAGQNHSLAIRADGSLWATGNNASGQLGNGTTTQSLVPTLVSGGGTYTQLAAGTSIGAFHSLGLRADGTAWAWGSNTSGQLGNGNTTNTSSPGLVSGGGIYAQLAGGNSHSLGLRADGTLYAWGGNTSGQLGDGTSGTNRTSPVVSGTALPTRSTAAGFRFGLAIRADGTLWAWGENRFGQLGTGTTTPSQRPVQVGTDRDWVQVAAGENHSLALKSNGTAWAWGNNTNGQLGDDTQAQRLVPTREATLGTGWTALTTGASSDFSLARTASGLSFASTGRNDLGQLGDGTTTQALRFDRVSPLANSPLPVQLTTFAARRAGPALVRLAWATASETDNAGFGVEKSADGVRFQRLAFVAGAGTSVVGRTYALDDAGASAAAYYRLAQTDQGGAVTYSPVRFVGAGAGAEAGGLVLVPNPARGGRVEVLGAEAGAEVRVYDALGRLARTGAAGLDVGGLRPGVYVVRAGARAARLVVE